MQGIIFTHFSDLVIDKWGMALWNELLSECKLSSGGAFVGTQQYDDSEMLKLVTLLSEKTQMSVEDLLYAFGHFLFPKLADWAPSAMKDIQSFKHLLMNIDGIIHFEVKKLYPQAYVPLIQSKEVEDGVELQYTSNRRLTKVMEGLIMGAATYFDSPCKLTFIKEINEPANTFLYFAKTNKV